MTSTPVEVSDENRAKPGWLAYGSLFYFGFYVRGGIFDELRARLAETQLTSLVREVEYYKAQHGTYPTSLRDLPQADPKGAGPFVFTHDPTSQTLGSVDGRLFFYELAADGQRYYLRSVGPDGQAFTADDIVPSVSEQEASRIGLLLTRR